MTKHFFFLPVALFLILSFQTNCMHQEVDQLEQQIAHLALDTTARLTHLQEISNNQAIPTDLLILHCVNLVETTKDNQPNVHAQAAQLAYNCLERQLNNTPGLIQTAFFINSYDLKQSTMDYPLFIAELNKLVAIATNRNIPDKPIAARRLFN